MNTMNLRFLTVAIALVAFTLTGTSCGDAGGEQGSGNHSHTESDDQHTHEGDDHSHAHNGDETKKTDGGQDDDEPMSWKIPEEEGPIIVNQYMALKDALVNTDQEAAAAAAEKFLSKTEKMDGSQAMDKFRSLVQQVVNAEDVAAQRKTFEELSEQLYRIARVNKLEQTVYRQYCPMAFDNEGANWFSTEEKIMNPYFGDQMLHCGEVKETIEGK